jgi:ABC-type Fe3+/spermidine/putrescine transport system ATPase subunit
VVMHRARVAQIGTPRELYEMPANTFVADFLGDSNLLLATVVEAANGHCAVRLRNGAVINAAAASAFKVIPNQQVSVLIRPEDMTLESTGERETRPDRLSGAVTEISYHGDVFKLSVAVGQDILKLKVPRERGAGVETGHTVMLSWKPDAARLLPADEGAVS